MYILASDFFDFLAFNTGFLVHNFPFIFLAGREY